MATRSTRYNATLAGSNENGGAVAPRGAAKPVMTTAASGKPVVTAAGKPAATSAVARAPLQETRTAGAKPALAPALAAAPAPKRVTRASSAALAAATSTSSASAAAVAAGAPAQVAGTKRNAARQPKHTSRGADDAQETVATAAADDVENAAPASKARRVAGATSVAAATAKSRNATTAGTARADAAAIHQAEREAAAVDSRHLTRHRHHHEYSVDDEVEDDALHTPESIELSARSKRVQLLEELQAETGEALVADDGKGGKALVNNLDEDDLDDPAMCAEYAPEIMDYLMDRERFFMPDPSYIAKHAEIKWNMRAILVDWLVEVHNKFKFLPETLFLSVNIMDRFLSRRVCSLSKFQLVGLVSLFIAAKTEEVVCPGVAQFAFMADNAFNERDMLVAEQYMLRTLDFDLWAPGPFSFIRRISKMDDYNATHRNAAKYFAEISLLDHRFLTFPPSMVAAASMFLARSMHRVYDWGAGLVQASGYRETDLMQCVALLLDWLATSGPKTNTQLQNMSTAQQQQQQDGGFFNKKYSGRKYVKFASLARTWARTTPGVEQYVRETVELFTARDRELEEAAAMTAAAAAAAPSSGKSASSSL